MIKKYALFPLLTTLGGFIVGGVGRTVSFAFANPIKTAVLGYLTLETNTFGNLSQDISNLSTGLFGSGVKKSTQNKLFAKDLSLEFQKEFEKFNSDMSKKHFKNVFYGYYTAILLGQEAEADSQINSLLSKYEVEFNLFKDKFIANALADADTPDKIKIVNAFNSKLDKYNKIFENNFKEVLKGLKEKASKQKLSEEDKKKLEGELGVGRTEPVTPPNKDNFLSELLKRRNDRRNRMEALLDQEYRRYHLPKYRRDKSDYDDSRRGSLKGAFYSMLNEMKSKDKKQYKKSIKDIPGLETDDDVFQQVYQYVISNKILGSPEDKVKNAFCAIMRREIEKSFLFIPYKDRVLFDFCKDYSFSYEPSGKKDKKDKKYDKSYSPKFDGRIERDTDDDDFGNYIS